MERLKCIILFLVLFFAVAATASETKTPTVLLQEALYAEEMEGDIEKAISLYEQVIEQAEKVERLGAEATYRLGLCYLKKGDKEKAAEYFQQVTSNYPSQTAIVEKAKKRLEKFRPPDEKIIEQAVTTISTCAEGDPRVAEALESIKGIDEEVIVTELVKFLDSETATVRRSAMYILWKGSLNDISKAVPQLQALCSHEEYFTRGMAAIALGAAKINSSFDTLCKMALEDSNGYARRCAAYALGVMGREDAIPILMKATKDSDPFVSANAEWALQQLGGSVKEFPEIVGQWQSVDFVSSPEQFQPGAQQWKGELFLKEITFDSDGSSSKPWRWTEGWIHEMDGDVKAQYYIKRIDGEKYLFFPWLSGDVTIRDQKPKYYVLKAVAKKTNIAYLPDIETKDTGVILDLASGKLLKIEQGRNEDEIFESFRLLGKGDIAYDFAKNKGALITLRVGKCYRAEVTDDFISIKGLAILREERDFCAYQLPTPPCKLLVITGDNRRFIVEVTSAKNKGININYSEVNIPIQRVGRPGIISDQETKRIYIPDADTDTGFVLDLASGNLLTCPGNLEAEGKTQYFTVKGMGDLFYDRVLGCLRGGKVSVINTYGSTKELPVMEHIGDATVYEIAPPCKLLVITPEGDNYEVKILNIENDGINIEYKKVIQREAQNAKAWEKDVFLPEDTKVLDLASGELITNPLEKSEKEILEYFKRLGKGDIWWDQVIGTIRGGKIQLLEDNKVLKLTVLRQESDCESYQLPYMPCSVVITTAEGLKFEALILYEKGGIKIKYKKLLNEYPEVIMKDERSSLLKEAVIKRLEEQKAELKKLSEEAERKRHEAEKNNNQ